MTDSSITTKCKANRIGKSIHTFVISLYFFLNLISGFVFCCLPFASTFLHSTLCRAGPTLVCGHASGVDCFLFVAVCVAMLLVSFVSV